MADTLLVFQSPVTAPDGTSSHEARACGSEMPGGGWQGWLEFLPLSGGPPVRSPRETTQPNRADTEYWATGLTPVFLEGALVRALTRPPAVPLAPPQPSVFAGPAPSVAKARSRSIARQRAQPLLRVRKGESLLRRQLGALSAWHLVNIALGYELADEPVERLNRLSKAGLIELIVQAIRERLLHHRPA